MRGTIMTTNDPTIAVGAIETSTPNRIWTHRMIAIGAAALVAVVAPAAVLQSSGDEAARPAVQAAPLSMDAKLQDLVNQGLIPRQALEPAPLSMDDKLQDLVNQGLIPRQALEPAPQSMDDKLQDLVNQGLIPRQALEPAPQSTDAKLQDLVKRGLIPRQALED
jgi:hypothetical protein